jgi:hypothetical protein
MLNVSVRFLSVSTLLDDQGEDTGLFCYIG